jgi:hypothetical protein
VSDIGAQANLYQRLRWYADLIDEVLLNVKAGAGSIIDERRKQLANLLMATGPQQTRPLDAAWFGALLRAKELLNVDWRHIGESLLVLGREPQVIAPLEELARALEGWRSDTANRMRQSAR